MIAAIHGFVLANADKGVRASNGIQLDVDAPVRIYLAHICSDIAFTCACSVQSRDNYLVAGPDADHPPDRA